MRVQELMSAPVATCHVNDTLNRAAMLMWDHDCGALPVVNEYGKVTGMITDRDICMAAYTQGRTLDDLLVNSAMASHVITARPDQTVGEVEQMMAHFQLRRLPVIDPDGRPIGIISLNDLATASVEPEIAVMYGTQKIAHTLAAICHPRRRAKEAA
jgi:CBS domain-containing protein